MKFSLRSLLLATLFQMALILPSQADQWGSKVLAHCYDLDDFQYQKHFFVRVFWTELGGGQLYSTAPTLEGPISLHKLNSETVMCLIKEKKIVFETHQYRGPTIRGACGLCEKTGFRLTVDDRVVWETLAPAVLGYPIFNGTIDVDKDTVRVCTEHRPEKLGVELPYKLDFFESRTSVLVCQTLDY